MDEFPTSELYISGTHSYDQSFLKDVSEKTAASLLGDCHSACIIMHMDIQQYLRYYCTAAIASLIDEVHYTIDLVAYCQNN